MQIQYNLKPGQECNEATYTYFLEVLPPIYHKNGVFQVDEPETHIPAGHPIYGTYQKTTIDGVDIYYYLGSLTLKQARDSELIKQIKGIK